MTTPSGAGDDGGPDRRRYARRTVLRAGAAVGGVGLGGFAAGQESPEPGEGVSTTAAITEQEEYGQDLLGFWVHLANELDPYEASVADQCAEIPWEDQSAMAFEAYLIDRTAEPETARLTVYLHDEVDVDPGELFIVNEVHPCEGPYVTIRIEQIGADSIQVGPRATDLGEGRTDTTSVDGDGMDLAAAVAALVSGGWLAHWLGDERE